MDITLIYVSGNCKWATVSWCQEEKEDILYFQIVLRAPKYCYLCECTTARKTKTCIGWWAWLYYVLSYCRKTKIMILTNLVKYRQIALLSHPQYFLKVQ